MAPLLPPPRLRERVGVRGRSAGAPERSLLWRMFLSERSATFRDHALPQRIVLKQETALDVVDRSRIGTSSLGKGELFNAPAMQQAWEAEVTFDAARLVIEAVLLLALLRVIFLGGPWPRPHGRVFDGHGVFDRCWRGARKALDDMQVLP